MSQCAVAEPHGRERMLVVDDEPRIRSLIQTRLHEPADPCSKAACRFARNLRPRRRVAGRILGLELGADDDLISRLRSPNWRRGVICCPELSKVPRADQAHCHGVQPAGTAGGEGWGTDLADQDPGGHLERHPRSPCRHPRRRCASGPAGLRLEQGLKNPELILTARGHPTSRSGAMSSNAHRALDRGTPLQAFTDRGPAAAPSRLTCLRPLTHGRGARAAPCASERLRCRRLSRPDRNGGDPAGYPSADRTAPDGAGPGILKECEAMAP
jgi:hypothetical protein